MNEEEIAEWQISFTENPDFLRIFKKKAGYLLRKLKLKKHRFVSHFHKITSDEIWHFYEGADLTVWMLNNKTKRMEKKIIGAKRGCFFAVVPAGVWFGASVPSPGAYTLVGCTVAPHLIR